MLFGIGKALACQKMKLFTYIVILVETRYYTLGNLIISVELLVATYLPFLLAVVK